MRYRLLGKELRVSFSSEIYLNKLGRARIMRAEDRTMIAAEINSYSNGTKKLLAKIVFDGKSIFVSEGKKELMKGFVERGIRGLRGKQYFPKDGDKFVRALPVHYRGSRISAKLVTS
jgi:hypothetical protein